MTRGDDETIARKMFEDFHDKPSRRRVKFDFGWPRTLQEVGKAQAQMYRSNKWKKDPKEYEDYKHIAEGPQNCYIVPGFLRDLHNKPLKTYGDTYDFPPPMPTHVTILAPLIGIQVKLYDESGKLPKGDKNLYEIVVSHGMLAGARFPDNDETFLLVYTKLGGVHMIITGTELDVEKDGIVG